MSILAEFMIVSGANNPPPMLDKPQYESWRSHMELYIQGLVVSTFLPGDDPIACMNKPKRKRDTWFKEKVLLVQAQAGGKELDGEHFAFLADLGVVDGQVAQTITYNANFQTDDLDAYDSDCDDISSTKAVLMANLSSCDSGVLSEVPYSNTSQNDMMNQSV
nr:hypothetical protein [Tanacetum cinerariifolium]